MNKAAVYHRVTDNFCYPLNEDELEINILTGEDVNEVILHYNDPFVRGVLGSNSEWVSLTKTFSEKKFVHDHIWWTVVIRPEYKRCRYYFELKTDDGIYYYFAGGLEEQESSNGSHRNHSCFCFPWMNSSDINTVPEWVCDMVWYQIYPDRFCNGNPDINQIDTLPWASEHEPADNHKIYGGDIQGISDKLDYLTDLGISGIYLTPLNKANSTHKYNTMDYTHIDEQFGSNEDLAKLVRNAHDHGLKIMLDGVFNHCGFEFEPWQDVVKNGFSSKYIDWFMVNEWPFDEKGYNSHNKKFFSFAFSDKMPKFNTNNPELREYLIRICENWIDEYDIDALRLDVANETSHMFLKELRIRLKNKKKDFYVLGESWEDSICWLRGDEFDSVMNYTLRNALINFWDYENLNKDVFIRDINYCMTLYMKQTLKASFNILDTHDTIRTMSRVNNIDKFFQQIVMLFAMPGGVCLYYGTEIAMYGSFDPDCRRCMPWDNINKGVYDDTINTIKKLIKIRKENKAFSNTEYKFVDNYNGDRIIELIKWDISNKIKIILNCSKEDLRIEEKYSENIYSNKFSKDILHPNGVVILLL